MNIDAETALKQVDLRERFGGKALQLLGSGSSPAEILLMDLSKNLFGAGGELLTAERYHSFRADGKLSKIKKSSSISCSEISSLEVTSRSNYSRWKFSTDKDSFVISFTHYSGRNGLNASEIFWYDIREFPGRSALLYNLLEHVLKSSLLSAGGPGNPEYHRTLLNTALADFKAAPVLAADGMAGVTQSDPFKPWSDMQHAFAMFAAGAAISGGKMTDRFMKIFLEMDGIWADILERLLVELERQKQRGKMSVTAVESTSEQFDRLSSLWYLRRIARLNFAEKHMNPDDVLPWSIAILKPRALYTNRRVPSITDPDTDLIVSHIAEIRKGSRLV